MKRIGEIILSVVLCCTVMIAAPLAVCHAEEPDPNPGSSTSEPEPTPTVEPQDDFPDGGEEVV